MSVRTICQQYHRSRERIEKLRQRLYKVFRSDTDYRRRKQKVPAKSVHTELKSRWGKYTGYAPRKIGLHLLQRYELAKRVLAERERRRDIALAPMRAARKAKKPIPSGDYVGTVPHRLGILDGNSPKTQAAWRKSLKARGKDVPAARLAASPCAKGDRFVIRTAL